MQLLFIATFTCQLLSDTRVKKTLQAPYKLFNAHNTSNEKKGKIISTLRFWIFFFLSALVLCSPIPNVI